MADRPRPPDEHDRAVRADLARLAGAVTVEPAAADLPDLVLTRIAALPVPARSPARERLARCTAGLRRHRLAATALAVALLIGGLAATPAGARIAQWLGLGAVQVVPAPATTTGPPDPAAADGFVEVTLDEARARVGIDLAVPTELGPPDRVLVGPGDRVVSMVWDDGDPAAPGAPLRLDQVAGAPDYSVVKKYVTDVEFTSVGGHEAFWLAVPHPLTYLAPDGTDGTEPSRIAGPALVWTDGQVTLRLEGVETLPRARQIAASTT